MLFDEKLEGFAEILKKNHPIRSKINSSFDLGAPPPPPAARAKGLALPLCAEVLALSMSGSASTSAQI